MLNNLLDVLENCQLIAESMRELLLKYAKDSLKRKMHWALSGRDQMNQLRASLEAHKGAIDIALDTFSV